MQELIVIQLNQILALERLVMEYIAKRSSDDKSELKFNLLQVDRYMKDLKRIYCIDFLNEIHLDSNKKEALEYY